MKILLVIHDYWPNYNAGTENHTHYLAQALSRDNDVYIFTTEPKSDIREPEIYWEDRVKVIKIHTNYGKYGIPNNTYLNSNLDQIFSQYLDEIQPDVVHIQHLIGLSLSFIDIVKERNIPLVFTLHDYWFECPFIRRYKNGRNCLLGRSSLGDCNHCMNLAEPPHLNGAKASQPPSLLRRTKHNPVIFAVLSKLRRAPILDGLFTYLLGKIRKSDVEVEDSRPGISPIEARWKAFREHFEKVDVVITPSAFLTADAIRFGIDANKIVTIPHGIPVPAVGEKNARRYSPDSEINFGFTSHVAEEKGFYLLLDAVKKLSLEQQNIRLLVYGFYHEDDREMNETIKNLSGNIIYKGVYDSEDTDRILDDIDVLVVPSLWNEIYGLVIDEAFLNNTAVIVSNRGGMPERVSDGKNGFVFDPDKADDLCEKMKTIAADPQILNDMQANFPAVKTIEAYASEVENVYRQLVNAN